MVPEGEPVMEDQTLVDSAGAPSWDGKVRPVTQAPYVKRG